MSVVSGWGVGRVGVSRGRVGWSGWLIRCGPAGRGVGGVRLTHVLLPVSLLLRRAYAAEVISGGAEGQGRRWRVPADRRCGGYPGVHGPALVAGDGQAGRGGAPVVSRRGRCGGGCVDTCGDRNLVGDVLAAVGAARLAMVSRFGCGVGGAAARGCRIGPLFDDRSAIDRQAGSRGTMSTGAPSVCFDGDSRMIRT